MNRIFFALLLAIRLATANIEADALLALKTKLLPPNSNSSIQSWKPNSNNPCEPPWFGVICNHNQVTMLNLSGQGLVGSLPSAIANLSQLEVIDLSNNMISSELPVTFPKLLHLKTLNLSINPLRSFPTVLLQIPSLIDLRMDLCNLTGSIPDGISSLSSLQYLYLGENNLTGKLPESLSNLKLIEFSLYGNQLNTQLPHFFGQLESLKLLNLHGCGLQGPLPSEWGESFKGISILWLYDNNFTGTVPCSWQKMENLMELRVDRNMLEGHIPSWMDALLKNSSIRLDCNYFSGGKPISNLIPKRSIKGNCFDDDLKDHTRQCHTGLGCADFLKLHPKLGRSCSTRKSHKAIIIGATVGSTVLLVAAAILWRWKLFRRKGSEAEDSDEEPLKLWEVPKGIEKFSFAELSKATEGFSQRHQIGVGSFGKVYRGCLDNGRIVAIKQASTETKQHRRELRNEIQLLSRLHHRHLVRLQGFCDSDGQQILVYEFMQNGNLHNLLLRKKDGVMLTWDKRLEIAAGVAQGLNYLHSFADPPVIHRDLKPSNILLDDNMIAKISDFGISKISPEFDTHISTRPAGTAGYLDPEYFLRRQLTTASDVYGFGVVLLELITGQKAIDHTRPEEFNLVEWVKPRLETEGIRAIVDPQLGDDYPMEVYQQIAELAMRCAAFDKKLRPSIKDVLTSLGSVTTTSRNRQVTEMEFFDDQPYSYTSSTDFTI